MKPVIAQPLATYATEASWRRIQALLPQQQRVDPAEEPTEEWLELGAFCVHLDCWRRADAPGSLVLVHGSGGNGRLLALYGAMAAKAGYEVVAPDLPGYGLTQVPGRRAFVYQDWRNTVAGVLEAQARRTERPVIVFGLSMGGMIAYDAAARTRIPAGLVATCLLDPRSHEVRQRVVRWPWMTTLMEWTLTGMPLLTDHIPIPMRLVGNMRGIANDPKLAQAISADPLAGGAWVPAGFLRTYISAGPFVEPDRFDVCPVLLVHPADDRWTAVALSRTFFDRLRAPKKLIMLEKGGHFPVEEPAATQLRTALLDFLKERTRL